MRIPFSAPMIKHAAFLLREGFAGEDRPSASHLSEALAAALGQRTYASLMAAVGQGSPADAVFDGKLFAARLAGVSRRPFPNAAVTAETALAPFDLAPATLRRPSRPVMGFELDEDDVASALQADGIRVDEPRARDLFARLDLQAVSDAAAFEGDLDEATGRAYAEIRRQVGMVARLPQLMANVVVSGFDELYGSSDEPGYVTEGLLRLDVTELFGLSPAELRRVVRDFGRVDTFEVAAEHAIPGMGGGFNIEDFPGETMRALEAVSGNMAIVGLEWEAFLAAAHSAPSPQGLVVWEDDHKPHDPVMELLCQTMAPALPKTPETGDVRIFGFGPHEFRVAVRKASGWEDAGTFDRSFRAERMAQAAAEDARSEAADPPRL